MLKMLLLFRAGDEQEVAAAQPVANEAAFKELSLTEIAYLITRVPEMEGILRYNVSCGDSAVVREDRTVSGESLKRQGTMCSDSLSEESTSSMKR